MPEFPVDAPKACKFRTPMLSGRTLALAIGYCAIIIDRTAE